MTTKFVDIIICSFWFIHFSLTNMNGLRISVFFKWLIVYSYPWEGLSRSFLQFYTHSEHLYCKQQELEITRESSKRPTDVYQNVESVTEGAVDGRTDLSCEAGRGEFIEMRELIHFQYKSLPFLFKSLKLTYLQVSIWLLQFFTWLATSIYLTSTCL